MNRTQKICLSLVCALALVLIPAYSWAQQDQVDRNNNSVTPDSSVNQSNQSTQSDLKSDQDRDINKSDQTDQNLNREKPSSTMPDPNATQNQNQDRTNQDLNRNNSSTNSSTTTSGSQSTYGNQNRSTTDNDRSKTDRSTSNESDSSREGLPKTAGELPLLALIGFLSLAGAAGVRVLGRANSR